MSQLIISLDFELFWGVADSCVLEDYRSNIEGVWEVVPKLLNLFRRYEIKATWATVGMLMCRDYAQWCALRPRVLPSYANSRCSNYSLGSIVHQNPKLFFARPLVEQILEEDSSLRACIPNRPPVVIEHLGAEPVARKKSSTSPRRARAAA